MISGAVARQTDTQQTEQHHQNPTESHANHTEPLRECVRNAMRCYLWRLDGHEVSDLHEMVLGEVERPLIETVLDHTDGNQSQAARMLGMSRSTLRKKMARYRVRQES
jgi:Fis family transcriptional regulator